MYLFRESRLLVLILVAASLLIIVNGCRRPTGQPSNRSYVGDSSEQGGGKDGGRQTRMVPQDDPLGRLHPQPNRRTGTAEILLVNQ